MAGVVFPGSVPSAGASAVQAAGRCRSTAYVSNFDDGTVTPVNTVTRRAGKPIALPLPGQHDGAGDVAVTPNGKKAYVVNGGDEAQSVTPITTAANKAGRAIPASVYQLGPVIAISADSKTAYVLGAEVTVISTATNKARRTITFPHQGNGIGLYLTADGKTLYALSEHTLTPISTATGKPGKGTALPFAAFGMAVTPNGRTVYVSNWAGGTVIPIRTATGAAGRPIKVGKLPYQIVITPNGMTAYVLNIGSNSVTPIKTRTNKPQKAVKVPVTFGAGHMLALTPNGKTLLVLGVRTVTAISTAHNHARKPIKIRTPADIAITRDGKTAWVITPGNNAIVPVNINRDRAGKPVTVGGNPVAIALKSCPATRPR